MAIRIRRVETRIVDYAVIPERVIVSPLGRHDASHFLTVILHGDEGLKGFGEAATVPLWSGESAETAQGMVENLFAPRLIGSSFDHPRDILAVLDTATWGNPFVKSAVDTAAWDLWAKSQNVPVTKLFADREPVASIPTRVSIGAYPVEQTVELAQTVWETGVKTLKFKTGLPEIDDVGRLRAVRERLGDKPTFTVDYNGAFRDAEEAVRHIESLLPFRLALVEQPTQRERISLLAEVRRRVPVPLLADESVFTPDQLAEALDLDAFDFLSVYPGKNGGFSHSLDMAHTAQKAGKYCTIGSNLETDLGQAAMACLAAGLSAFPVEQLPCDLPAAFYYVRSSITSPLVFRDGRVRVPTGPGFGVVPCT